MRKIEIGSGQCSRVGYETCDVRNLPGVDHVCKADALPFEDESVEEVYSRHLVEHLTLKEFLVTLTEWNRVLRDGGTLYIICPNLLWHLQQILEGSHESFYTKERGRNARYWGFGSLFGWQQDEYDVHKFGYYFALLRDILESVGFSHVVDLTNTPESYEQAPHHLEVRAQKISPAGIVEDNKFFTHFTVTH